MNAALHNLDAPKFTDFFETKHFSMDLVKHGETLFNKNCSRCHGVHEKAWSLPNASKLPLLKQLETTNFRYFTQTPVVDVGTDPSRNQGASVLARLLNPLSLSKYLGLVLKQTKGYVPPPLVGIWARWPYFHNNSVPTLCDVLKKASDRPTYYYAGNADDKQRDFDRVCNGYPTGDRVPPEWIKNKEAHYDTRRPGLKNSGHDAEILLDKDGNEKFNLRDKRALVQFLQTL